MSPGPAPAVLALTLAASCLFVDVHAESAFDAPKRAAAAVGCAVAAALVFGRRRGAPPPAAPHGLRRASAWLFAAALALAGVSALASPRRPAALDAWRFVLVLALAAPLGASGAFDGGLRIVFGAFLAAAVASAVLALGEAAGVRLPLPVVEVGGRSGTGALFGNEGLLAIVLALAAVGALAVALRGERRSDRRIAAAALVPIGAALVVNRNLTSLAAALAGGAIVAFGILGKRAMKVAALAIAAVALAVVLYGPARGRIREAFSYVRAGEWDRLSSYRAGPWVAALEMIRERPWTGFGPGTFGAEYAPHRLTAEIRRRARYVNPIRGSAYLEAHCDYLQAGAEAGLPAAAAGLGAFVLVLVPLAGAAARESARRAEVLGIGGLLCTGAIAALTWFPLQRAASALVLLLAAGRAWRISAPPEEAP